jgi:NAD(P)-dependent dehydrogenase (short-subunit alcohol dehydrogenase family)
MPSTIGRCSREGFFCLFSGQIDYLVNNAGVAQGGAIEEVSPTEALAQFNTNFFGLVSTILFC